MRSRFGVIFLHHKSQVRKTGFSSRAKLFQIVQFGIALTQPAFHLTQFRKFPQITILTQRTHTDLTQFDITPFVHLSTSFGTHGSAKDKKFHKCSSFSNFRSYIVGQRLISKDKKR